MTGFVRRLDIGRGFVRARECPDCFHTRCGEDCVCNCDAAHAEAEAAHLRGKVENTTWRPIEEFEDPKEGSVCLGWFRDGAPRLVTHHLGKWLLYGADGGDARGLTHIHSMGPIRGPGEG